MAILIVIWIQRYITSLNGPCFYTNGENIPKMRVSSCWNAYYLVKAGIMVKCMIKKRKWWMFLMSQWWPLQVTSVQWIILEQVSQAKFYILNTLSQPSSGRDNIFNCKGWQIIFVPQTDSLDLACTVTLHSNRQTMITYWHKCQLYNINHKRIK